MAIYDPLLQITVNRYAGETVVAPAGDVDIATAPALHDALDRAEGDVVLDLRDVEFIDARGLRVILDRDASARAQGRHLTVLRGRPEVHRVFELTRADRTVRILEPAVLAA
jgi:anti-sigma B factor antagonist